ncbi:C40 family peptidase [Neobacillus ginsengisoli]|uniref:Cell wall-associated NlpC family hydrolase n=1 Tax=Neobacillus ginsengisoli TaxID=904295 RepID=A0ABT9XYP1_9BACI|nr:NlpC/P60 family protein [Neobacillus ginsengisoli]MDQ0200385.1 cell wall-associated NlpC family hydrolase [Neobacillus ginsengisoli]
MAATVTAKLAVYMMKNRQRITIVIVFALSVMAGLLLGSYTSQHQAMGNIHSPAKTGKGEHANNLKTSGTTVGGGNVSPLGEQTFTAMITEAQKYIGWPYVWGGANPTTGFDCSGFTQWTFAKAGIKLPRTAQEQYDASLKILPAEAKPGDLVFYTGTYASDHFITHIGIYLGKGKMLDSDDSGIGIHTIHSTYWKSHLAGFGRVLH